MPNIKDFSDILKIDPLPQILENGSPAVKYLATKYFYPSNQQKLNLLKNKIKQNQNRNKLLQEMDEDGHWEPDENYSIEKKKKAIAFQKQLQNLTQLLYLGADNESESIKKALIRLIKYQKQDGKFPLSLAHHGYALWLLAQYGLATNPIVERGYRWLVKRQREDGGWISSIMKTSADLSDNTSSCLWTTVIITQAFSNHTRLKNSNTTKKAADFLTDHFLYKNHTSLFPEKEAWDYLYTDHTEKGMFRGGMLRYCEALAPLKHIQDNDSLQEGINYLSSSQLDNGLFPAKINSDTTGDYHVTFRVLKLLDQLQ